MMRKKIFLSLLGATAAIVISAPASAQVVPPVRQVPPEDRDEQEDLETAHSVLQKTGLGTLAVTGVLGGVLAVNHGTAFGDGRCSTGDPVFGSFGCSDLKYVHFGFAAATLGLFVATEVVAEKMPRSPYESHDAGRENAMKGLRVANIALFATQPVLGVVAANPQIFGLSHTSNFAKVMRTIHLGVGGTVATTYTVNTALQW